MMDAIITKEGLGFSAGRECMYSSSFIIKLNDDKRKRGSITQCLDVCVIK